MKTSNNKNTHDFNGSKFTSDPESFISALKTIKIWGGFEDATVPVAPLASKDYDWGSGKQIIACFPFITDEDIDLFICTPPKKRHRRLFKMLVSL